jgi:hypothetical protein
MALDQRLSGGFFQPSLADISWAQATKARS